MEVQMKITGFSGDRKNWERWNVTFLAKARLRGYRNLLVGLEVAPSKGTKGHEEFMVKNDITYAELLISSEWDICLGLVNSSRSEDMPEGDARLAWKNMVARFAPTTKANLIKTRKQFVESKLDDIRMDPDEWIQNLELLKRRLEILGAIVSEMDLIIHIMHNLPAEYETTIEFIENELESNTTTLERVKERLQTKLERLSKFFGAKEQALLNRDSFQTYKGLCSFCVIYGHKGSDCRKRMAASNGTSSAQRQPPSAPGSQAFRGMCFRCKKKGHKVQDCPVKNRNNLEGANLSRETKITLIGAETDEIHPNLWIGDTGATSHMTCCATGLFDARPSNHSVLVGDGQSLNIEKVGKLKLVFEGKGQETTEVLLEEVKFVPMLKVNLFSFTVAMKKGAKIYTEGTSIILEKEGKCVVF
jgi:gag-polypeptide of LTR copia-type